MDAMTVLVTGGNRGIGLEICRQLARAGHRVVLGARDIVAGSRAVEHLVEAGLMVGLVPLDVTDPGSVAKARTSIGYSHGELHALVDNAGGGYVEDESVLTADLDVARATFELDLFAPWRLCQEFTPMLQASGRGRIVNVSSGAGSFGDPASGIGRSPGVASYAMAKLALNALTVKLAAELREYGVLVNAVCPGFTATRPGLERYGARPVADGAKGVVWAATLPDDGPTGGFFRDGAPIPW